MTITEFLLARITEDEGAAWRVQAAYDDTSFWELTQVDPSFAEVLRSPPRLLAECEAKRRIIERYADCVSRQSEPDYSTTEALIQSSEYEDWTLLALASVYADHDDYREEWRL